MRSTATRDVCCADSGVSSKRNFMQLLAGSADEPRGLALAGVCSENASIANIVLHLCKRRETRCKCVCSKVIQLLATTHHWPGR